MGAARAGDPILRGPARAQRPAPDGSARSHAFSTSLLEAGLRVPHLCCRGTCGTCQTGVIDGIPEHRDMVLRGAEDGSVDRMMPCVSRSLTPVLSLDL